MSRSLRNAAVSMLILAAALWGADPFVGAWKLNTAKSKFKQGQAPKEQTVTLTEVGSNLEVTVQRTGSDGKSISYKYSYPAKGGDGTVIEAADFDAVKVKRKGEREMETHFLKGGKELRVGHSALSADGKTRTLHTKGVDVMGKPTDATLVFEKQ